MKTKLGQETTYKNTYWPEVLDFIPRDLGRASIPFFSELTIEGADVWNGYEFSWLASNGCPEQRIIQITVPAASTHICESKSLKLYLGSFAFERVTNEAALVDTITCDLSKGLGASCTVSLLQVDDPVLRPVAPQGVCIDDCNVIDPAYEYNPSLLTVTQEFKEEHLYSHSFRSLCPVTSQPDWASVFISYKGNAFSHEGLYRYLISLRNHQGFHESCTEKIYCDIMQHCQPQELGIICCFTRRGGLDITPIRYSSPEFAIPFQRTMRQ